MNQSSNRFIGRFAVLWHQIGVDTNGVANETSRNPPLESHFDLLMETDVDRLLAWRFNHLPDSTESYVPQPRAASKPVMAERIPDHRLLYLEYEGPISGNRGCVTRVHEGFYRCTPVICDAQGWQPFPWTPTLSKGQESTRCGDLRSQPILSEDRSGPISMKLMDDVRKLPHTIFLAIQLAGKDIQCEFAMETAAIGQSARLLSGSFGMTEN